jgi:hypothetical protein
MVFCRGATIMTTSKYILLILFIGVFYVDKCSLAVENNQQLVVEDNQQQEQSFVESQKQNQQKELKIKKMNLAELESQLLLLKKANDINQSISLWFIVSGLSLFLLDKVATFSINYYDCIGSENDGVLNCFENGTYKNHFGNGSLLIMTVISILYSIDSSKIEIKINSLCKQIQILREEIILLEN